jgi:hypothetical protein
VISLAKQTKERRGTQIMAIATVVGVLSGPFYPQLDLDVAEE